MKKSSSKKAEQEKLSLGKEAGQHKSRHIKKKAKKCNTDNHRDPSPLQKPGKEPPPGRRQYTIGGIIKSAVYYLGILALLLLTIILIHDRGGIIWYQCVKVNPTDVEITSKNVSLYPNVTNQIDVHLYNRWKGGVNTDLMVFLSNEPNKYEIVCSSVFP